MKLSVSNTGLLKSTSDYVLVNENKNEHKLIMQDNQFVCHKNHLADLNENKGNYIVDVHIEVYSF